MMSEVIETSFKSVLIPYITSPNYYPYLPIQDGGSTLVRFTRQTALFNHHKTSPSLLSPLSSHIDRVIVLKFLQF